jgi:hypothetical protein
MTVPNAAMVRLSSPIDLKNFYHREHRVLHRACTERVECVHKVKLTIFILAFSVCNFFVSSVVTHSTRKLVNCCSVQALIVDSIWTAVTMPA